MKRETVSRENKENGEEASMNKMFTAVILAGGKSLRMGFDKQILPIGDESLFSRNFALLKKEFDEILVVTNHPEYYKDYRVTCYQDIISDKGPLSGIHAALRYANTEYILAFACDMPKLNPAYIGYMKKLTREKRPDACVTGFGDYIEPFCGVYGKTALEVIEKNLKQGICKVKDSLDKVKTLYIPEETARKFSADWSMFDNLNTKEEYERYLVG